MRHVIRLLVIFTAAVLPIKFVVAEEPPNLMVADKCAETMEEYIAKGEHLDRPLGCVYQWGENAQIAVALIKEKPIKPGFAHFEVLMRKKGEVAGQVLQAKVPVQIPVGLGATYAKKQNQFPAERFSVDEKNQFLIVIIPPLCGEPQKSVEYRFDGDRGFIVGRAIIGNVPPKEPSKKTLECVSNS